DRNRHRIRSSHALTSQKFVDARLRTGPGVDLLDDHRTVELASAGARRKASGHHDRPRRNASITHVAAGAIVDPRALPAEYAHAQHRVFFDDDAFDDLGAGAYETIVFDNGGVGLQGFQDPADAHSARQMHILAD